MQPTIINYSRVSSSKQQTGTGLAQQQTGTGLAQQQDRTILDKLSTQYDLPLDERTFSDVGKSAFHGKHLEGDLGKLISLIHDGSIASGSIIVIFSLDRLSRQHLTKAVGLLLQIIGTGVRIHTTIDNRLYDNDSDSLMADLMMSLIAFSVAAEESQKKSARSINAAQIAVDNFLAGKRTSTGKVIPLPMGKLPFWLARDAEKGIIKHPANWPVIQKIAQMSLDGHGNRRICKYINEHYPKADGKDWGFSLISRVSTSPALYGSMDVKVNGTITTLTDYYIPVITKDEFLKIQRIKSKTAKRSNGVTREVTGLISGSNILKCAKCGGGIRAHWSLAKQHLAYVCLKSDATGTCDSGSLNAKYIEPCLFELLSDVTFDASQTDNSDQVNTVTGELTDLQTRLTDLQESILDGTLPKSMWGMLTELEQQITDKHTELKQLQVNHVDTTDLFQKWNNFSKDITTDFNKHDERLKLRALILQLVTCISIHKNKGSKAFTITVTLIDGQKRFAQCEKDVIYDRTLRAEETDMLMEHLMNSLSERL